MDEYEEWLENLKKGDTVFVINRYGVNKTLVSRVTKTLIFTNKDLRKYRKSDGNESPYDSFSWAYLAKPTEKLELKLRKQKLVENIRSIIHTQTEYQNHLNEMNIETLEKILDNLSEVEKILFKFYYCMEDKQCQKK